jgi:hypothetical protein
MPVGSRRLSFMRTFVRRAARASSAVLSAVVIAGELRAQVVETPEPFDSAGQVRSVTPPLAARLQLGLPAWPVIGDFVEARLFGISTGGFVIVVERRTGQLARYALTAEQRNELRAAVTIAMARFGQVVGEERPLVISEPARGAFVRNQMVLAATIYGPALAALTGDPTAGTAVYLVATGATFFTLSAMSRRVPVSRAQNHLSTDGGVRGALMANGLVYVVSEDNASTEAVALATLAGGIAGAVSGFRIGRGLTDSEAKASTAGSTFLAATTLGTLGAAGLLEDGGSARPAVAATIAAGLVGYPVGLLYPRRARYTVTAGDVDMLGTAAALGVMTALTPVVDADTRNQVIWAAATAGLVGGLVIGDRLLVRPYNHTQAEATQVRLGAAAGGLIGLGAAALAEAGAQATVGLATAGAILGTLGAEQLVAPARAGPRRTSPGRNGASPDRRSARFAFTPGGGALAAVGVPGRHAVLSVRF